MGSSSQRRKERHAKKRQEKKKKLNQSQERQREVLRVSEIVVGSNARHRQRLLEQVPRAWPGEPAEDVAIFDDAVLSTLSPELAQQVSIVRGALQDASESRGEDALNRTSAISRSSPLSDWRLFIRGLVDWLANDTEAANEAWKRLNPERRPARIASVMMSALRPDLDERSTLPASGESARDASPVPSITELDAQLLYHAKLLQRMRFDRSAIRIAEAGVKVPEESHELLLGLKKLEWLRKFVAEYGDTEPDLANALAHVALGRAACQEFSNVFEDAARGLKGPRHDPQNRLLTYFYFSRFANDSIAEKKAQRARDEYLKVDLPRNDALSAPLRSAIASQIHLNEALLLMVDDSNTMENLIYGRIEDQQAIREHLSASVKADPANQLTYKSHVSWIESKLESDRLTKAEQTRFESELIGVMRNWSKAMPEEIEPRLWLVDTLLEDECLEEAKPHVDFLAASRHEDPRVRATPWKWQLLEAMRLCRRKAWIAEVPARLDAAETQWPAWMSKNWLPYLKAAWTLRSAGAVAFEDQRQQHCQESGRARDSLADACMMLGAAQQMRVPANDLKPLRAALDQSLKRLDTLPADELLEVAGFFWDLHRAQLSYPAYRMHAKNIGKALLNCLAQSPRLVPERIDDERIQKAVLWGSKNRFWSGNYDVKWPSFFASPIVRRHPIFAAAMLNAVLSGRYRWEARNHQDLGPILREAAPAQRDPYYRFWFVSLADELDETIVRNESWNFGSPFGNMFGMGGIDDEDDDDDLGFDPNCDCPKCQAAKRAYENAR